MLAATDTEGRLLGASYYYGRVVGAANTPGRLLGSDLFPILMGSGLGQVPATTTRPEDEAFAKGMKLAEDLVAAHKRAATGMLVFGISTAVLAGITVAAASVRLARGK